MIKISIVIPVYNVSKVLRNTMESIITQTLQDIEIICVDDCSQDNSRDILNEYAAKDARIKLVFHETNRGLVKTRKDGVLETSGKYIMFLDGDDKLVENACEQAFNAIEKEKVDIVQFATHVANCAQMAESTILQCEKNLMPNLEKIEREDLISAWWEEKRFSVHLWNKIYKSDLCKKAYEMLEDGYFLDAEDWYAMIAILRIAKSYVGISDRLYQYNYGLGVTGGSNISLERFKGRLTEKYVIEALYRFANEQSDGDRLSPIINAIEKRFLGNCINIWKTLLNKKYVSDGFNHLANIWGIENIICYLAEYEWGNELQLTEKLKEIDYFDRLRRSEDKKKVVAIYVSSEKNENLKREVDILVNLLENLKDTRDKKAFEVILVTEDVNENIWLSKKLNKLECVPGRDESIKEKYRNRYVAWHEIISKHEIDIIVATIVDRWAYWDMLSIKAHQSKPAYIVYSREFCGYPYPLEIIQDKKSVYQLCDGVVTTSESDRKLASVFASHTKYIPNPLVSLTDKIEDSIYDDNILIWKGIISNNRRPLDAIHMMNYIVKKFPKVKLYMQGEGDKKIIEQIKELINRFGLDNSVHLVEKNVNVESFYNEASIYICTSEIEEAWPPAYEAMMHAIPVVSYDLPWLTLYQDGRGIRKVKQGRWDLLAEEVENLLQSKDTRIRIGQGAKELMCELLDKNIGTEWGKLFDDVLEKNYVTANFTNDQLAFRYLSYCQNVGRADEILALKSELFNVKIELEKKQIEIREIKEKNKSLKIKVKKLRKKIQLIKNSTTFNVGRIILFIPIKIKKFLLNRKRLINDMSINM